ncbi:oxidoreductase [Clostridium novyi A str. 4552]|uniref:Oxidoreductase n=1 Tax=Clostridium novyi A str. 4552 TaxID=1444289 RepID=A0A0A0I077_CLONO|nr:C-GCAxxG-C-C family (seleno)protein [Clostridium novyi]KGM94834.1 oxidoreductase [Clostridium novyi A str. 4552]
MTKVLEYNKQGYNCAESIVKAFNEEEKINIPVSIASPFGGGMTVGGTCGAVIGALIVLGSLKGREDLDSQNESRTYTRKIMNKVQEKYGTFQCLELKKKGVSCSEIIEYAYSVLKESIE